MWFTSSCYMAALYYGVYVSSRNDCIEILDSFKSRVLYSARTQKSKLSISIYRHSNTRWGEIIAQVTFHRFSSRIDIQMQDGQILKMRRKYLLSKTHHFECSEFRWSWKKERSSHYNLSLIYNSRNGTVAKMRGSSYESRKLGDIAFLGDYSLSMVDLIVITCLSKLGYRQLDRKVQASALTRMQ